MSLFEKEKPQDPLSIVERKYSWPYWIFMREFRDDTGFGACRSADGLAVGLYASRGQVLIGFEQKVSRSDWLAELKNPDKAEAVAKFCDYWNLVVPDASIVKDGELPLNWGMLLVTGKRVKTLKPAVQLNPLPISRYFLSALVKRAVDDAIAPYIKEEQDERKTRTWKEGYEAGKTSRDWEFTQAERLEKVVKDFEATSGIELATYSDGKNMGEAVRALLRKDGFARRAADDARRSAEMLEKQAKELSNFAASLEARA